MNDIIQMLALELGVKEKQVKSAIELIDEGNTIPFIARYRKEVTGNLDDEILRMLDDRLNYLRNLQARKEEVIRIIAEQEKLTKELEQNILNAKILTEVEDMYRPFKQKKNTKATIAKEKGLEPLADYIQKQIYEYDFDTYVSSFVNEEKGVLTNDEALQGAKDIIAERISDDANFRKFI